MITSGQPKQDETMSIRNKVKHPRSAKPISAGVSVRESREIESLRQNQVVYKSRIRSLELELGTLKYRLDSLRKAKNTTVVRREVECVRVSSPKLGRHRHDSLSAPIETQPLMASLQDITPTEAICDHGNLLAQLENLQRQVGELLTERASRDKHCKDLVTRYEQELKSLREKSQTELRELKERVEKTKEQIKLPDEHGECTFSACKGVRQENKQLRETLEKMTAINHQLRDSNKVLQGKCETLLEDLSIKEARWIKREEALKEEIRKKWGERYHEWMVKAEKKMEELQQINTLLQTILQTKAHNPDL